MNNKKLQGVVAGLIGAFVIYWAQTHSPKAGIGNMIANELSGSYTMSENNYYLTLGLGIVLVLVGLYRIFK